MAGRADYFSTESLKKNTHKRGFRFVIRLVHFVSHIRYTHTTLPSALLRINRISHRVFFLDMTTRQSRRTTAKRSDYYTDTSSSASSEDDRSHTDASMMDIAGTAEDRMPAPDMPPAKPKRNRSRSAGQPAAQRKTRKTGRRPEQKISSSSSSSASDYDDEEEEGIGSASQNVDADPGVDQREKEKEKDPTEHIGERPSVAPMAVEDGVGRVSRRRRPRPNNNAEAGASNDGSADPDKEFR